VAKPKPLQRAHRPAGPIPVTPVLSGPKIPVWLLTALLALGTLALYWPATRCDFVNYDDPDYFTLNPWVRAGLTLKNLGWAFTTAAAHNWHPLTWLSLMLDVSLFGRTAAGPHFTNLVFHAINVVLLFWLLRRLTGAVWRSALVAALFGWHPVHVESVAWVSERKDVLSTAFGLLALWFYAGYARARENPAPARPGRPSGGRGTLCYWSAWLCFALGLLSKPMLVTWPFVLLLLDYWPLTRFKPGRTWPLFREKIPFFALAAAVAVVTFLVQKLSGAMVPVDAMSLGLRSENALLSYCRYLGKLFWPDNLAFFYPHPHQIAPGLVLLATLFLASLTSLCWWLRRRQAWFLVGWLWYLGTLVPVIGLVQVGAQSMADRYAYIPSIGILIMTVWGAVALVRARPWLAHAAAAAFCVTLLLCLPLTRRQISYWQNSEALFRHAIEVIPNNHIAHNNLGISLLDRGQTNDAISQFQIAIALMPNYPDAHYNLGNALIKKSQPDEAIAEYQTALRLNPNNANAHVNLGVALDNQGRTDEAVVQYQATLRLQPDDADTLNNLGYLWVQRGENLDQARALIEKAVQLDPRNAGYLDSLGLALLKLNQPQDGLRQLLQAVARSTTPDASIYEHLGDAYAALHQNHLAATAWQKSLALAPNPDLQEKLDTLPPP